MALFLAGRIALYWIFTLRLRQIAPMESRVHKIANYCAKIATFVLTLAIVERSSFIIAERHAIIKPRFYEEQPNVGLCWGEPEEYEVDRLRIILGGALIAIGDVLASLTCLALSLSLSLECCIAQEVNRAVIISH